MIILQRKCTNKVVVKTKYVNTMKITGYRQVTILLDALTEQNKNKCRCSTKAPATPSMVCLFCQAEHHCNLVSPLYHYNHLLLSLFCLLSSLLYCAMPHTYYTSGAILH